MRPRKLDRHLPACVFHRNGAFYYVKGGKWRHIGRDLASALHEYARIVAQPTDGLPALIDKALPSLTAEVADSTRKQYVAAARKLRDIFAEFRPEQVKPGDVVRMLDAYRAHPASANRLLVVLRLVYSWGLHRGEVDTNPCIGVKAPARQTRDRLMTPGEFAAIRAKANPRLRAIMDLCYLTGQRVGDVLAIKRSDLRDDGIYFEQQKTGKKLIVQWTPDLRAAVAAAKAVTGNLAPLTLFYGRGGKPPAHQNVWRAFKSCARRAGVEDVTLHDMRAMSGTDVDRQGGDATALLGHTDARTTAGYLRDKSPKLVHGPGAHGTTKKNRHRSA
jgi:integrase